MTNIYEIENRVLVPNWRDFKRTIKIGELGLINSKIEHSFDNDQIKFDWNNQRTLGVAADLINNCFVANDLFAKELNEAIVFVENDKENASASLLSLIDRIKEEIKPNFDETNRLLEKSIESVEEFKSFFDHNVLNKIISKTKNLTKDYKFNAIYWIELARLYTIKGQIPKADKCIRIALQLAPENRFVLRSATRYFVHNQEEEKAIYYLRKSNSIKSDPWLISAHIAVSNLINRHSPLIKDGFSLLKDENLSSFEITELASSLGTLELKNGSFKKSKPLLDLSLIFPNDNSLAQFEWLSKKDSRLIFESQRFNDVKNPFEAFAYENFKYGNFNKAFYNCIDWFLDLPFSKRPLMFASYLATITQQYDSAVVLCLVGLKLAPTEIGFFNNLIYNYCLKNDLENAEKFIQYSLRKKVFAEVSDEEKIMMQATIGLYYIRSGNIEKGKELYRLALENANLISNDYYLNQAILNFTRELFLVNDIEYLSYLERVNNIKSSDVDILYLKEEVVKIVTGRKI